MKQVKHCPWSHLTWILNKSYTHIGAFSIIVQFHRLIVYSTNHNLCSAHRIASLTLIWYWRCCTFHTHSSCGLYPQYTIGNNHKTSNVIMALILTLYCRDESNQDVCPVKAIMKYQQRKTKEQLHPQKPFFLTIKQSAHYPPPPVNSGREGVRSKKKSDILRTYPLEMIGSRPCMFKVKLY